jgi:CubicO group peptidase (beta-lactamase class C family)
MLVQNTSGYADYVRDEKFVAAFLANPFASWDRDELVKIAMTTAPFYPPGTAWSYAHTNYVVLGEALEAIGGDDLGSLITHEVIDPLDLRDTAPARSPAVPDPVMHSYTSERDVFEDSTFWNPSWQTAPGSVITSTICDMASSATGVGSGKLLGTSSRTELVTPAPASLEPPPASCSACIQFSEDVFYGLGVISSHGWIYQSPLFAGAGGVAAYLPDQDLTVAVLAVAGKDTEPGANVATEIWQAIARQLSPDHIPVQPGS